MKVLTLNTHSWLEESPEEKLVQLATNILENEYDVIALQEVNQQIASKQGILNDLYCPVSDVVIHEDNFALRLVDLLAAQEAEYYWTWTYSHIGYWKFHEGLAILSKMPILPRDFLVSLCDDETSAYRRMLLTCMTEIEGKLVTIANGHYSWWSEEEKQGFVPEWLATEKILQESEYPVILMGDFNNPSETKGYQLILNSSLKLQDTYKEAKEKVGSATVANAIDGWRDNQGELRIDYIFTTAEFQVARYQVVFDGISGPVVSDHFGVVAELSERQVDRSSL